MLRHGNYEIAKQKSEVGHNRELPLSSVLDRNEIISEELWME